MFCPNCGQQTEQEAKFCSQCGGRLPVAAGTVTTQQTVQLPRAASITLYAGFWKRLAALILDWLITLIPGSLIAAMLAGLMVMGFGSGVLGFAEIRVLLGPIGFLLWWLYFAYMESSEKQATYGKRIMGIKVVDLQGNRITFRRASGRVFAKIVSGITLAVGYLMAAFTKRKQALHDMMASCLVVNKAITSAQIQQTGPITRMSTAAVVALVIVGSVVPIAGIVAAIAIPAYHDHAVRAGLAEVGVTTSHRGQIPAVPWNQIADSPKYQTLPPETQEGIRLQYFDDVIAPHIPQEGMAQARKGFDEYSTGRSKLPQETEIQKIENAHPGWQQTVRTQDFSNWKSRQPPSVLRLGASESAQDAILMLDLYKRDHGLK